MKYIVGDKVIPSVSMLNKELYDIYQRYNLYKNINDFYGVVIQVNDNGTNTYYIKWFYETNHKQRKCKEINWVAWIPAEQLLQVNKDNIETLKQHLVKQIKQHFDNATQKDWEYWFSEEILQIAHEFGYPKIKA